MEKLQKYDEVATVDLDILITLYTLDVICGESVYIDIRCLKSFCRNRHGYKNKCSKWSKHRLC